MLYNGKFILKVLFPKLPKLILNSANYTLKKEEQHLYTRCEIIHLIQMLSYSVVNPKKPGHKQRQLLPGIKLNI